MIGRRVEAVTFDATGTLFHAPELGRIYSEVLARHGIDVSPDRAAGLVRQVWQEFACVSPIERDRFAAHPGGARGWWRRFLERLCEHLGSPPPSRFAAAELYDRFAKAESWRLFPEVPDVLDELRRRGLRLGVISNWDERLAQLLDGLDLASRLEVVVTSSAVGVEKPHGAIFEHALSSFQLPAQAVVHVGNDRRRDLEGAQAVGMHALLVEDAPRRTGLRELLGAPWAVRLKG